MADLKLVVAALNGKLEEAVEKKYAPIAKAAAAAIGDAAGFVKSAGRANIALALGARFANSWRVNVYPSRGKPSADAALFAFSRIGYANIFETGGAIHGQPMLWLPTKNAPPRIGRQRITPALYISRIGPLAFVKPPGRLPMLVANIKLGGRTAASGRTVFAISTLRRGAAPSTRGVKRSIVMFIGHDAVTIRKRINIQRIAQEARNRLPASFVAHLTDE